MDLRPALFLDRDGVINVDHGYVIKVEDFEFIDGIFKLCASAKRAGFLVIVVTNQAGIGRGYYSELDFKTVTKWMCDQFAAVGADIDGVYHCPYHPEHGIGKYKRDSPCRKPAPGMLLDAAREHSIDMARSILVGDKVSDIQAALAAGVGHRFLFDPLGAKSKSEVECIRISSLTDVINHLQPGL